MTDSLSESLLIEAPAEAVFAALTDTATHAEIDGTGNVRDTGPGELLTAEGQVFRMPMYHPNHPDKNYTTANLIEVFDPPRAIMWRTGYDKDDGTLGFGGWFWRYDLAPADGGTLVTLTYDWTATSPETRERIGFPPFTREHFARSLAHLGEIVTRRN